jgi:hypothetical protein
MFTTSFYISKLVSRFDLVLYPDHPDKCGGLKFLGDFCLLAIWPVLIFVVLFGIYGIGGLLYGNRSTTTIFAKVDLLVALLATYFFFAPLLSIHRRMAIMAEKLTEELTSRVTVLKTFHLGLKLRIASSLYEGNLEQAKADKEKMDIVQTIYPDIPNYPRWPFRYDLFLKFLSPQIVPILVLVL